MAAVGVSSSPCDCDAAVAAMEGADADLDPVWGLLVGDADAQSNEEAAISSTQQGGYVASDALNNAGPAAALAERCSRPGPVPHPPSASANHVAFEESAEVQLEAGTSSSTPEAAPRGLVVDKAQVPCAQFPLSEEVEVTPTRWDVPGCDAFVLDGVLTQAECEMLISQAEAHWSFWDNMEKPRVEFRNAHTIEVLHNAIADRIWRRVGDLVNPSITVADGDERFEVDIEGEWRPYAMNPILLLSRYLNGGHFSPHTDGTTIFGFNRRTFYSCVLFLNSSPWGGETRIYSDEQIRKDLVPDEEGRMTGDPSLVLKSVPPVAGRMLVFYHRLMHEGVPAAEKYIIRTDVSYHRTPEICTAPEDVEAFKLYEEAQLLAEKGHCTASVDLFRRAFKRSPALAAVYKM